jgi:predicted NAD-dependent protein-ADP-ribosyltransferase YbiA (DUF1768 family)
MKLSQLVNIISFSCSILCFEELFNDEESAEKILRAQTPRECKELGRAVKYFNNALWMTSRTAIVMKALELKVSDRLLSSSLSVY